MKCPHCRDSFHDQTERHEIGRDVEGKYDVITRVCPSCKKCILELEQYRIVPSPGMGKTVPVKQVITRMFFRPKGSNRPTCPTEVPTGLAEDYKEACLVLADSPKASAALSRRCLQNIIHNHLLIKLRDLNAEIQAVIDQKLFPGDILESIDSIRAIGNFAAHPIKSTSSGEVVPVEPDEAEWNLDVLEMIFDYQFVRPALVKKKRDALNSKLKDAGKPDIK